MTFYGDFTLAKDEAFGDYHVHISQISNRHIRATVKTYEKTGLYIFLKLFRKNTDGEFTLWQKICFTQEEFEKLLGRGKLILQPPTVNRVTKKPRKPKRRSWKSRMTTIPAKPTRKTLTPTENMVEAMFERSPDYFKQFRKNFRFSLLREKPKLGVDFQSDMVLAFGLHSPTHDGFCNDLSHNHYHVLAQCFGESHKGQPKSCCCPVYIELTPY